MKRSTDCQLGDARDRAIILSGSQRFEYYQQRETARVGQQRIGLMKHSTALIGPAGTPGQELIWHRFHPPRKCRET